jgi:hypothetical protein
MLIHCGWGKGVISKFLWMEVQLFTRLWYSEITSHLIIIDTTDTTTVNLTVKQAHNLKIIAY